MTDRGKGVHAALSGHLWQVADQMRAAGSSADLVATMVAPLAGLLVLRWAAFMEAETEAVSAFNDTTFAPLLPESLRQRAWGDAHGLPSRVSKGLPEIGQRQDVAMGR